MKLDYCLVQVPREPRDRLRTGLSLSEQGHHSAHRHRLRSVKMFRGSTRGLRRPAAPIASARLGKTFVDGYGPLGSTRCRVWSRSRARKSRFWHRSGSDCAHTSAHQDSDLGIRLRADQESLANSAAFVWPDLHGTAQDLCLQTLPLVGP